MLKAPRMVDRCSGLELSADSSLGAAGRKLQVEWVLLGAALLPDPNATKGGDGNASAGAGGGFNATAVGRARSGIAQAIASALLEIALKARKVPPLRLSSTPTTPFYPPGCCDTSPSRHSFPQMQAHV